MTTITITQEQDRPFSAFGLAKQAINKLKDVATTGENIDVVFEGLTKAQAEATTVLIRFPYLAVSTMQASKGPPTAKTIKDGYSIEVPGVGTFTQKYNAQEKRATLSFPAYDDGNLPIIAMEFSFNSVSRGIPEMLKITLETDGKEYSPIPCPNNLIGEGLLEINLLLMGNLAVSHGFSHDTVVTVRGGIDLGMGEGKMPQVLVEQDVLRSILKQEGLLGRGRTD